MQRNEKTVTEVCTYLLYLSKKNANKNDEISVVVMHSLVADDRSVVPQMLKSFRIPMKLPYTQGKVKTALRLNE